MNSGFISLKVYLINIDLLFNSTHERKYLGFQIALLIIDFSIDTIFTPNFSRTLITNLSKKSNLLHKSAVILNKKLEAISKTNENVAFSVMINILSKCVNYDQVTRTNTIQTIIKNQHGNIDLFIDNLFTCFHKNEFKRDWVIDQVSLLLKNTCIEKSEWVNKVLDFLIKVAFKGDTETISENAQSRLFSSLHELSKIDSKWLIYSINQITCFADLIDPEILDSFNTWFSSRKQEPSTLPLEQIIMFHFIDSLINQETETLIELIDLYYRLNTIQDLNPSDVLVDIFIQMLSRSSSVFRQLALVGFTAYCSGVTEKGIDVIFRVLGDSGNGNEEADDVEDDGDDVDEEMDKEIAMDLQSGEKEDVEESVGEDEESSEESDQEPRINQENSKAVKRSHESDSESEDLLSDSEMQQFDDKLVELFKEKKRLSSEKRKSNSDMIHFKIRVIDLLDVLIKKQAKNPIMVVVLKKLLPLCLKAMESKNRKIVELNEKIVKMFNKLVSNKQTPSIVDNELLKQVFMISKRQSTHDMDNACGMAGLFLVRCSKGTIGQVFVEMVQEYLKEKSRIPSSMFRIVVERYREIGKLLEPYFKEYFENAKDCFKSRRVKEILKMC